MTNSNEIGKMLDALSLKQSQIAENLASGNTQMRSLAKRVWRVQEDERKHIARELHDGVGQLLTALINQLEMTTQEDISTELQTSLQDSLELARQALSDTRKISRLMRPRILDDLGLEPALKWLTRVMKEEEKTDIVLQAQLDHELDGETQTLVFRIVQESINNAVKHAKASTIKVQAVAQPSLLMVKVSDDGVGMDTEKALGPEGFGLSAMQDRVAAFGGQLMIQSKLGEGSEIKMVLMGNYS
ncbi:sensor histidine kinase [Kangiella spongicola]|uniref:Oxygen sensor histidine kinase NreB n=1 Tax=Kangiella spongicola TaxID=796379 RepID=A0A318D0L6_9GAMM|nr:sensor histidine kinase [Kangiella spongicola]PXF62746.1 sensor histidine kinase [Kangiella spongicola]